MLGTVEGVLCGLNTAYPTLMRIGLNIVGQRSQHL